MVYNIVEANDGSLWFPCDWGARVLRLTRQTSSKGISDSISAYLEMATDLGADFVLSKPFRLGDL